MSDQLSDSAERLFATHTTKDVRRAAEAGTFPQALWDAVAEAGQATVTEMSVALNITRATASVMVNDLIRSGSVAAVDNHSDRRSFYVRLTEYGLHRLQSARNDLSVLTDKLSKRYPGEVVQVLYEFARPPK